MIGTPGRLKDLLEQGKLDLDFTDTLVLDEADRMLDMGFIKDVRFLCDAVPAKRQTLCFSATVTPEIQRLLDNLLTNPVTCSVRTNTTNDHIHQSVVDAGDKTEKVEQLHDILIKEDVDQGDRLHAHQVERSEALRQPGQARLQVRGDPRQQVTAAAPARAQRVQVRQGQHPRRDRRRRTWPRHP